MLLHSGHTTACYNRHDSDIHIIHRRLELESDHVKTARIIHCAHRTCTRFASSPTLAWKRSRYSWNWDIDLFLLLWYWNIEWRWHLLKKSRCWDVNLTSSRHRWLKCVNSHQALRWTQQCRDSRKLWEQWDCRCQNCAKTWESGSQSRTHLAKTLSTGILTFNGHAGTLDPAYPALLKTARQSPTVVMATPPHEQQSATLLYLLITQKGARKVAKKTGNNGFGAYRQLCLMYATSDQEGSTGPFVQIMTNKFGSKIEDVEDRLNEFLELVRRYDEANGTDPVPDQVKKASIISNTPEPLKTHLQLNVAKLGNFNALRVTTEDYLRSRRIFKTTSAMEVDAVSRKGIGKEKSGKGKKGGKKGKESHSSKGYKETTTEHSRFEGECRNWKVWTQSIWLLLQADEQIFR